jgi:uncharacterized protein YndB with AHSA1/START domain
MASFSFKREIAAPPQTVFEVLTDHRRYPEITRLRKASLEREGEPVPDGVGAIRVLSAVGPPMREEVIAFEPPTRFSYKLLSGLPARDHVGTVELTPADGGTRMVYAVHTTPTVPFGGAAVIAGMKLGIKQLIDGVRAESERRACGSNG